jgi:hypothetical protein
LKLKLEFENEKKRLVSKQIPFTLISFILLFQMETNVKLQKEFKETLEHQVRSFPKNSFLNSIHQVNILNGKYAEQDATAQTYKKRIQENVVRVQGMTQEISSLHNEMTERNQTIREKVIILLKLLN